MKTAVFVLVLLVVVLGVLVLAQNTQHPAQAQVGTAGGPEQAAQMQGAVSHLGNRMQVLEERVTALEEKEPR